MAQLEQNSSVGNFTIVSKIGEGGMAEIYKAMQPALKRPVVIKKLKDPNREIIARFKKEALLSASFNQENVLSIYDFMYLNRSYYLVMEYVEGEDLRTIIDHSSPMPVSVALLIATEIARGLEYTHNQNIIHRDIKPSNVLISFEGTVKLIDFGVAKDEDNTRLTMTGLIVGTPSYMSPEQAHGDALGPPSDIFGLGVLLYEMLTGLKPFYGSNNTEVLARVARAKYTPPERINPRIPRRARRVIRKMLRRDTQKRYQDAATLIRDLEKCVPWNIRRRKKNVIEQFLKKLDKSKRTTSEDTLKAAFLEKNRVWGWRAIQATILLSALVVLGSGYRQFTRHELGYLQLFGVNPENRLRVNGTLQKASGNPLMGPFLRGEHEVEVYDAMQNSRFIARIPIAPADTSELNVRFSSRIIPTSLSVSVLPEDASVRLDNFSIEKGPQRIITLQPGWHNIEITRPGYETFRERRFFNAGENYSLFYKLSNPSR